MNRRRLVAACVPGLLALGLLPQAPVALAAAGAGGPSRPPAAVRDASAAPAALTHPARVLPPGWRTSPDRVVTVAGDATGLHVLVADASDGYAWNTVATLGLPGTDTTQWIGQACLTGAGERAVVVYAPRQITNAPDALGYGALAAVVNLATGKVTDVGAGVSIAYFDPGCGTGQDAVLTQGGTGASPRPGPTDTRLMLLDAVTGKVTSAATVAGQVTSAVPADGGIAGVRGAGLVIIGAGGRVRQLAAVRGQAYSLAPDGHGGLGFLVASGQRVQVRRQAAGRDQLIGSAPLGAVGLSQVGGEVFVTGEHASRLGRLPARWRALDVTAGADVSSTGMLAVSGASTGVDAKGTSPLSAAPDQSQPVQITAQVTATGRTASFTVPAAAPASAQPLAPIALPGFPGAGPASRRSPRGKPATGRPAVSPPPSNVNPATTTYDPDRSCSVPRNDPGVQTYQPSAAQVEWAADQAVQDDLTNTQPANLYGSGLPAYSPQGWFPAPGLSGGGSVPAQVLLGILAQESNEDQASDHAIIGQTGNFEPSYNWYGDGGTYTYVDWQDSDCGYGIAQVTSGMCLSGYPTCSDPLPSYDKQLAVAVDYEANIAAGLQILEQKWNQLHGLDITANGGNPQYVENWWFALWAYNSGLEPSDAAEGNPTGCSPSPTCTDPDGYWGLGWVDNPANPLYPPDRPMFLSQGAKGTTYNYNWDVAHPQYWSYEEKVVGFGAYGFLAYNYIDGVYENAFDTTYYGTGNPTLAEPSISTFCSTASGTDDNCDASKAGTAGACQLSNDHCWWHWPVTWIGCSGSCGVQTVKYAKGTANPGDPGVPAGYPPECSASPLPSSAVIVGDTASSIPAPLGCGTSWHTNGGTMTWDFAAANTSPATYPSKIDFHQIGGGYSGHFWFTHTLPSSSTDPGGPQPPQPGTAQLQVTGTWTPPGTVKGWYRIMAAIPNEGAWDPDANYQIVTGSGHATQYRVVNQAWQTDTWQDLGVYDLSAGAHVSLSNVTYRGLGYDIAWDAMAFVPSSPAGTDYVALGDSYSAGEGNQPFDPNSDFSYSGMQNACHRSVSGAYPRMVTLPGQSQPIAGQAASPGSGVMFHFTACSGAETTQLTLNAVDNPVTTYDKNGNTDWGAPQVLWGELPQTDQGWLSPATTLVTVTIGGNDARFSDVITGCILTLTDCTDPGYKLTRHSNGAVDPEPLIQFEPVVIGLLKSHLEAAYQAIASMAPNAEIIVLGYPELFPANPQSSCTIGLGLSMNSGDQAWLNKTGSLLDSTVASAVSDVASHGTEIHFVNPISGFSGHEICSSDPWINGLVAWSNSGSGLKVPGAGSFHPKVAGQQEYARLVDGCLAGTVSC